MSHLRDCASTCDTHACVCRPKLWFWNSASLYLTLALAISQVFATTLDPYFQVAIMLVVLICGLTLLAQLQPFLDPLAQQMQASHQAAYEDHALPVSPA